MNNGVCIRDKDTGVITQLFEGLNFGEALKMVASLRGKRDGNWYWVGQAEAHKSLK